MNNHNNNQAVYSITKVCKILKLSRAQFYNLQKDGVFPPCLKHEKTNRSYMDENLKNQCLEIKKTGISFDGSKFHLFYEPRKETGKPRKKHNGTNQYAVVIETLKQMGIKKISQDDINNAIAEIFPDEIPADEGVLIRELFKYFKNNT